MQTFLPYPDFKKSASVLDMKRLGKQRVETFQILKSILLDDYGWKNHPAVKMWKDYPIMLLNYGSAICHEWRGRGYKDTCENKMLELVESNITNINFRFPKASDMPWWIGWSPFHESHQSNLSRKNPEHYKKYWNVPIDGAYIWPVK